MWMGVIQIFLPFMASSNLTAVQENLSRFNDEINTLHWEGRGPLLEKTESHVSLVGASTNYGSKENFLIFAANSSESLLDVK